MEENLRQKGELPPPRRRKKPSQRASYVRGHALRREHHVPVIGEEINYWVKIKQARHLLHTREAFVYSQKPFVLKATPIIERVYSSNFVCRQLREHREELISQVSKAKTGKPRRAYNEAIKQGRYVRLPYGFGRDPGCAEKE